MSSDEKLKPVQAAALGFGLAVLCGVIWKTVTSEGASSSQQGRGSAVVDVDALDRENQRYDQRSDMECIENSFGRAYELLTNLPSFFPSFFPSFLPPSIRSAPSPTSLCPILYIPLSLCARLGVHSISKTVRQASYAVRGAITFRAAELRQQLKEGKSFPFKEVISCNIGECIRRGRGRGRGNGRDPV